MKQEDIISYFDAHAPTWDNKMICSERIVNTILSCALLTEHPSVLDVACGTGILFPFYLKHGVASVTAIDISGAMVDIARSKAVGPSVEVICGDAQVYPYSKKYDAIMIYNAFPHFTEPGKLLRYLIGYLLPGGTITVAHGMSRNSIATHHAGSAAQVSIELPSTQQIVDWLEPYCTVTTVIDTDEMYQLTAIYNGLH